MKKHVMDILLETMNMKTEVMRKKLAEPGFLESLEEKTAKVYLTYFYRNIEKEAVRNDI
nr:hypothetical protein [Pantoea allii]